MPNRTLNAMTYFEFQKQFPTEEDAINFIVSIKYKDGYVCPKCGIVHKRIYHQHYGPRKLYCKNSNSIESCWAVLKRSVYGIFHHVSVKYLQNYVDEFCFRLNNRDCNDAFLKCVRLVVV